MLLGYVFLPYNFNYFPLSSILPLQSYHFNLLPSSPFNCFIILPFYSSPGFFLLLHLLQVCHSTISSLYNFTFQQFAFIPFNNFTTLPPSPTHLNTFVFIRGAIFIFWSQQFFFLSLLSEKREKEETKTHFRTRLVFFLFLGKNFLFCFSRFLGDFFSLR